MATGVKPRDDEPQLSRIDLEILESALKKKEFRNLLADYCEHVQDPENQALYQREMIKLEKQRGVDVTFVNSKPGYVMKTSVAGDRKAFINICSSDTAGKPACTVRVVDGTKGLDWHIPYTLIPPREDYDLKRERCVVYDVVFHPDTLRMAANNARFRELVNKTALDALQNNYNVNLDCNNVRFPRSLYKGCTVPAVIRIPDPNFINRDTDEVGLAPEVIEKLYPQHNYSEPTKALVNEKSEAKVQKQDQTYSYTTPKYIVRQQKTVDLQDYTYNRSNKRYSAIPTQLMVEVNMPLISSTSDCILDVRGKQFSLLCEKPAKYKLAFSLPYFVDDERGNAKFDTTKRSLIVTLPVSESHFVTENQENVHLPKQDSGVESEGNSSASDEESLKIVFITELNSTTSANLSDAVPTVEEVQLKFLDSKLTYLLPAYTCNLLEDIVAFTFHVKNTDPSSVTTEHLDNTIFIKFTSIGNGYAPAHYSAIIKFEDGIIIEDASAEAWDNNVILHLNTLNSKPDCVFIGLDEINMSQETLTMISTNNSSKPESKKEEEVAMKEETAKPMIEVTNMAKETTVTVTSIDSGSESYDETPPEDGKVPVWKSYTTETAAKSILRKTFPISRSLSESSAGDIASSIDYISSDCIPEESSLKKTVRFSDVIARQFYRYNSSIEGQKKKNQRKKSKKRNQERRKSESEAEDEVFSKKGNEKNVLNAKERRDSGVASDGDADDRRPAPTKFDRKTESYNAIKGKYSEVNFKNDLIFDLDI